MKNLITILICIICFTNKMNAQWSEQTSGITTTILSVSAIDNNIVWACGAGGVVLRTINSGLSWSVTTSPNPTIDLFTIQGIDAMTALVGGSGASAFAYKTTDGGATWTQTFAQAGGFINAIKHFNGFPVYGLQGDPVGGRWTQFISFDFGSSWDSTGFYNPAPPGEAGWNNSFFCATPSFFSYYGTNNTKVYQPFANGTTLSYPTPGLQNSLAIWGNDNSRLMTGGDIMLYTINGGVNWTNVNAIGTGDILGICGANSKWYYVRGSSVYFSPDDGANWSNDHTASGTYNHISLSPLGGYIWAVRDNGGISRYLFDIPLPVELLSFYSVVINSDVILNWSTVTETNNFGFEIERSSSKNLINSDWSTVGFVNGNGTTTISSNYSFKDMRLNAGKFNYRLKQIDLNGNFKYFNLSNEVVIGIPNKFELSQNYPNPFNPTTTINYSLPFESKVNIKIFDMSGKEIQLLMNENKPAGYFTLNFNGASLPSGIYFYTIVAESNGKSFSSTKKMTLIK
ncbi:MAG: T9SS type A sorting domain-containing protein [Bacteroidota bacterium]|nr:T9SS type A sorting domain-containing protein [Bacteroidota bacterium]